MEALIASLDGGVRLAAGYYPVTAAVGAAIGAALLAKPNRWRTVAAWAVLLIAWFLRDGACATLRLIAVYKAAQPAIDRGASAFGVMWSSMLTIAIWMVGAFAYGYVAPMLAGAFVGRRVTWGTGFLGAAAVAVATSAALATIAGSIR